MRGPSLAFVCLIYHYFLFLLCISPLTPKLANKQLIFKSSHVCSYIQQKLVSRTKKSGTTPIATRAEYACKKNTFIGHPAHSREGKKRSHLKYTEAFIRCYVYHNQFALYQIQLSPQARSGVGYNFEFVLKRQSGPEQPQAQPGPSEHSGSEGQPPGQRRRSYRLRP